VGHDEKGRGKKKERKKALKTLNQAIHYFQRNRLVLPKSTNTFKASFILMQS